MKLKITLSLATIMSLGSLPAHSFTDTGDVIESGNNLLIGNTAFGSRSYTFSEIDFKDSTRLGNAQGIRGELVGGDSFTSNIELVIGDFGEGLFTVGALLDSPSIIVGRNTGSMGTLQQSINTSLQSFGADARVTVGEAGIGRWEIGSTSSFATANIQNLTIGAANSGDGTVLLGEGTLNIGSGSIGGHMIIGDAGTAIFQRCDRCSSSVFGPNSRMVVGAQPGSYGEAQGSLSVSGDNARLVIGESGHAVADIRNGVSGGFRQGGNLNVNGLGSQTIVAQNPGSTAIVTAGYDSIINAGDALHIGQDELGNPGGNGQVNLSDTGGVLTAGAVNLGPDGTLYIFESRVNASINNSGTLNHCSGFIVGNVINNGLLACDWYEPRAGLFRQSLIQTSAGAQKVSLMPQNGDVFGIVAVTGSAQISGSIIVEIAPMSPTQPIVQPAPGDLYTILTAAGGLTVDPGLIITNVNLDPTLAFEAAVDATSLTLRVIQSTTTITADLAVSQSGSPDPVVEGSNLTYQISVTNLGPDASVATMLTDTLPADVTFVSASPGQGNCAGSVGSVSCDLGSLALNQSVQVAIVVVPQLDVAGAVSRTLNNTVTVTDSAYDPDLSNNSHSEQTQFLPRTADLAITKTSSTSTAKTGEVFTYDITVANIGPETASNVVVTDMLPGNVGLISTPTECSGTTLIVCAKGSLANGDSYTLTLQVEALGNGKNVTNTASVSSSTPDPDLNNNQDSASISIKGKPRQMKGKSQR